MKILIAPFPAKVNQVPSAKHYPYWPELVSMLKKNGHEIIQIGVQGEERIDGVDQFLAGWPFEKIRRLMETCDTFVSVDSWFPHFAHYHQLKPGVVLWGKSNPHIWGYIENENLFVGESNFRQWQFQDWHNEPHDPSVFVPPRQVVWAVERYARTKDTQPQNRLSLVRDSLAVASA